VTGSIVPRWEWRTFGERFGEAESRITSRPRERISESDELYLLSSTSNASVKVRDELMDVKRLEEVDADGLERWKPVAKAAFPLSETTVRTVMDVLGEVTASPTRAEYTLDELLEELVGPSPDLVAVEVHKRRSHYTIGGCMAELSEVRVERGSRRTIAIESEDPDRVKAVIRELGLDSLPNVSLPRELKTLLGFGVHRFAVLDVGTNSVKFIVGELQPDGSWHAIVDRADVTRLGEGLDRAGRFGGEPIERTVAAIEAMAEEARRLGVEQIATVGTAGLRLAANRQKLIDAARERAGVEVEVIDGEEEGRLAYLAVKSGLGFGDGSLVVFDTGGGSSQFTFGSGGGVDERFSVNVGAARFTEKYGLGEVASESALASALEAIASDLASLDGRPVPDALVGMGGAVTNLTAVKLGLATYDPDAVQGAVLDSGEVDRQIELFRTRSAEQRREIVGLQPNRAEVILAGACIVRTVLAKLGKQSFTVSDRGLRHGLLIERFGQSG
jgi:exopolyphosphatase/guanosine-5'-triphosphate,3'-diphosphate pyrophosphatase